MVNKVEIKVNYYEIVVLNTHLSIINTNEYPTRALKVAKSALIPICKKLITKSINRSTKEKKVKINMAFYEAHFLELFLRDTLPGVDDEYSKNLIMKISNEINKQLA